MGKSNIMFEQVRSIGFFFFSFVKGVSLIVSPSPTLNNRSDKVRQCTDYIYSL